MQAKIAFNNSPYCTSDGNLAGHPGSSKKEKKRKTVAVTGGKPSNGHWMSRTQDSKLLNEPGGL